MAKLFFYYSTMNADKATSLVLTDYNYSEREMETMLFTAMRSGTYAGWK